MKEIVKLRHEREDPVSFVWVKAHVKNSETPLNVEADKLAYAAMDRVRTAVASGEPYPSFYLDSKGRTSISQELKLFDRLYEDQSFILPE